jgi:hypothetical protein
VPTILFFSYKNFARKVQNLKEGKKG